MGIAEFVVFGTAFKNLIQDNVGFIFLGIVVLSLVGYFLLRKK